MSLSRRSFIRNASASGLGAVAVSILAARGREALAAAPEAHPAPVHSASKASLIRIDSNENPYGPAPAALDAMRAAFGEANRYPDESADLLREAIAARHGVAVENVVIGCGSTEILKACAAAFTSPERGLVTAAPSFESLARFSDARGAKVVAVPVTGTLQLDLDAMASNATRAGLVYVCNPNNPTAAIRSAREVADFIARAAKDSPETTILVDEAYFDFVADPGYGTAIPVAMENPRVVVARTFSKIFGLAGMRVGYAVAKAETIAAMRKHVLFDSVNGLGAAAAVASLKLTGHIEAQAKLNADARDLTRRFFEGAGYKVYPSHANFMMVDVKRDSRAFREACRASGVAVGRPFPPLTIYARISIGTADEMRRACDAFKSILA